MTVTGQLSIWVFCEKRKKNQGRHDSVHSSNCYVNNNLQLLYIENLLCARYYAVIFVKISVIHIRGLKLKRDYRNPCQTAY